MMALVDAIPRGGMAALPTDSEGRDVARQLVHLAQVRESWIDLHESGQRPKIEKSEGERRPTKAQVRKQLKQSSRRVRDHLELAMSNEAPIRFFKKSPTRFFAYLLAHESHHRGSIVLALKQSGSELEAEVTRDGFWREWIQPR